MGSHWMLTSKSVRVVLKNGLGRKTAAKTLESGKESGFRWLNGFTESIGWSSKCINLISFYFQLIFSIKLSAMRLYKTPWNEISFQRVSYFMHLHYNAESTDSWILLTKLYYYYFRNMNEELFTWIKSWVKNSLLRFMETKTQKKTTYV